MRQEFGQSLAGNSISHGVVWVPLVVGPRWLGCPKSTDVFTHMPDSQEGTDGRVSPSWVPPLPQQCVDFFHVTWVGALGTGMCHPHDTRLVRIPASPHSRGEYKGPPLERRCVKECTGILSRPQPPSHLSFPYSCRTYWVLTVHEVLSCIIRKRVG